MTILVNINRLKNFTRYDNKGQVLGFSWQFFGIEKSGRFKDTFYALFELKDNKGRIYNLAEPVDGRTVYQMAEKMAKEVTEANEFWAKAHGVR